MKHENFGKNLKEVLEAIDMKPTELAKKAGLAHSGLSILLEGRRDPQLATVIKIMNAIPVSFERLVR